MSVKRSLTTIIIIILHYISKANIRHKTVFLLLLTLMDCRDARSVILCIELIHINLHELCIRALINNIKQFSDHMYNMRHSEIKCLFVHVRYIYNSH